MNKANLHCIFGKIPEDSPNLEIVGAYDFYKRELPWASVWGDSGLVVDNAGEPLWDCLWQRAFMANCPDFKHSKWRFLPKIKLGTYFNTMLYWCRGYYHWICDVLPRLQWALPHLPPETLFVVPANLPQVFRDSLRAIGVSHERCVEFSGRRPWRVQKLIHVPPVAMTGDHTQASLDLLRETIFRHLQLVKPKMPHKKIYICRRCGLDRVLTNEAEILDTISHFDFEPVYCEDLSFGQQVRMFSEAEFVLGPHGGGMTNTIWCNSGTKVLEIFNPLSVRRCYWSIAQAIGLKHACGIATNHDSISHHGMSMNLGELEGAIQSLNR